MRMTHGCMDNVFHTATPTRTRSGPYMAGLDSTIVFVFPAVNPPTLATKLVYAKSQLCPATSATLCAIHDARTMPDSGKLIFVVPPPFTLTRTSRQLGQLFASPPRKSTSALMKSNATSFVPPADPPSTPVSLAVPPLPMKPATVVEFAVWVVAPPDNAKVLAGYHVNEGDEAARVLDILRTSTPCASSVDVYLARDGQDRRRDLGQ